MPRAVLDSSVLISAFLTPKGVPDQVLDAAERGDFTLCVKGGSIAYRMAEQNCTSRLMRECLLGALVL